MISIDRPSLLWRIHCFTTPWGPYEVLWSRSASRCAATGSRRGDGIAKGIAMGVSQAMLGTGKNGGFSHVKRWIIFNWFQLFIEIKDDLGVTLDLEKPPYRHIERMILRQVNAHACDSFVLHVCVFAHSLIAFMSCSGFGIRKALTWPVRVGDPDLSVIRYQHQALRGNQTSHLGLCLMFVQDP